MTISIRCVIVLLVLAIDALFCLLAAAGAGLLAHLGGASRTTVLTRGGVAFAGSATLSLAVLTFLVATLCTPA
ncbi:hypothetical protein [Streptomyces syringium]|uniref:hypothetical protein n=1 Tax=Streptomyces syringium TaxID=76729 RepID=UPI0037CCD9E7